VKVQELFEALNDLPTPPHLAQEIDKDVPLFLRTLAKKHDLTARIDGGPLQRDKKYVGRGYVIELHPRGYNSRKEYERAGYDRANLKRAPNERVENYDAFWKEAIPYLTDKFDLRAPIRGPGSKSGNTKVSASAKMPSNTRYKYFWAYLKGVNDGEDPKKHNEKIEHQLRARLVASILRVYSPIEHWKHDADDRAMKALKDDNQKALDKTIKDVKDVLEQERENGNEFPEIEKMLDPSTFKATFKTEFLKHHQRELRSAVSKRSTYLNAERQIDPGKLSQAMRAIERARQHGHALPELEKILPLKDWPATLSKAWDRFLVDQVHNAMKRFSSTTISEIAKYREDAERHERAGHELPKFNALVNGPDFEKNLFKIATRSEDPTTQDVVKYILTMYKDAIKHSNVQDTDRLRQIMKMAERNGYGGKELDAIKRSMKVG